MTRKVLFDYQWIPSIAELARAAGAVIIPHYRRGITVDRKEDASPVTEVDRAADRLIVAGLRKLAPDIPIVSEEGERPGVVKADYFWLVDPLDGTKSFIRGSGYFTVNIALIGPGRLPLLGVVYDPVSAILSSGSEEGAYREEKGARQTIHCRSIPQEGKVAYVSHSHLNATTEAFLVQSNVVQRIPCASSIKFCFVAEGKADLYPRFGPTMEWDTAAGHAVLIAAGGDVKTPEGAAFYYGKENFLNGDFVAFGR